MDSKQTRQTRKLDAEELEKRVAPGTLYVVDEPGSGDAEAPPKKQGRQAMPGKD